MKNIEQQAKEVCLDAFCRICPKREYMTCIWCHNSEPAEPQCHIAEYKLQIVNVYRDVLVKLKEQREELLRWRDPKKEQPEDGATVLGKTSDPKQPLTIMKYYNNIWWIWAHPCWAGPSGEVIGWRPIYD